MQEPTKLENSDIKPTKQQAAEYKYVKTKLKRLSKSQLIAIIVTQTNKFMEVQDINNILVEELKSIKE